MFSYSLFFHLTYVGSGSKLIEKKIVEMANRTYFSVNPRILVTSKPILQRSGKDPMLPEEKSPVVYKFKCYCKSSDIGKTSRHLKTRIKEHVPKCIISHISDKKD